MTLDPAIARRNQVVTVAMVFAVFTGFAFVLPFLPLYVRELGVEEPERAALWAGILIGISPLLAGFLAPVWGRLADRFGHSTGHGIGLEVHEAPRLSSRSEEVLVAGHVVTVEPGVYLPAMGGVRIEDDVVVEEAGRRSLTHFQRDLIEL